MLAREQPTTPTPPALRDLRPIWSAADERQADEWVHRRGGWGEIRGGLPPKTAFGTGEPYGTTIWGGEKAGSS